MTFSLRDILALAVGVVLILGGVGHLALDGDHATPRGAVSDAGSAMPYMVAGIVACVVPTGSPRDVATCDEVSPRHHRHRNVWITEC